MKICMIEVCNDSDKGSLGCKFIIDAVKKAGFEIDVEPQEDSEYDVELISVHHSSNYYQLSQLKQKGKIRIVGGHYMQTNPRPAIRYADVLCIGEGETWIVSALNILKGDFRIDALSVLNGTIISKDWLKGGLIPPANMEKTVPDNTPVLSRQIEGHSATWYIEIGRGCPFSCNYCELGHSVKARMRDIESVKRAIDMCDPKVSKKLHVFAPDEASHKHYPEILEYIYQKGFSTQFGSMRLDQIMRRKNIPFKSNMLIRVGIDGLSERIRFMVNKKLTDDSIIDYFHYMFENGHVSFKIFMIFSYSFETMSDWNEFEELFRQISNFTFKKCVYLQIKFTPFIPTPTTPMENEMPLYNFKLAKKIKDWYLLNKAPKHGGLGIRVKLEPFMNYESHKRRCELAKGDEDIDLSKYE